MKRISPRWCGGFLLGLLLTLGQACTGTTEPPPTSPSDAGTDGGDTDTTTRRPYVVFVVDRSSTMILPIDTTDPDCRLGDGSVCGTQGRDDCPPTTCPTRWRTVKAMVEPFLAAHATKARFGLAFFPATMGSGSSPEELCRSVTECDLKDSCRSDKLKPRHLVDAP